MARTVTNLPKISIVIPSYNKADYIEYTLQSIVDQKYPDLEVIIQDGSSTDGTVEIIKKFAQKYPKVFVWSSKKDKGQVAALSEGFNKATGSIFCFINADDLFDKNALITVGTYFLDHPETLWLVGYGNIINADGMIISLIVSKYKNFLLAINNFQILLIVNYINQPSVFLSAEVYRTFGPIIGTKKYILEYELWLKLGKQNMPAIVKKNLASFRLTMDNLSATFYNEILDSDYQAAGNFTKNGIILFFHRLHNLFRVGLISILKFYEKLLAR